MHGDLWSYFIPGREEMNVAVSSVLTAAEYMVCLVTKSMVFSWYMGWQMENSENREEKALVFAPNILSLGFSLQ